MGFSVLAANITGSGNTALGASALVANTTGSGNTALGTGALDSNTTASSNTAVGMSALASITASSSNTAVGRNALTAVTLGGGNTAVGVASVDALTSGSLNVALGTNTLAVMTTGSRNIAIGDTAGALLTSGSDNIYIGHEGTAAESGIIRIGRSSAHDAMFVAGVRGVMTGQNNATAVLIDSNGQLGTASSTRRVKEDIADLGAASRDILRVRPVQFRYRQAFADGSKPIQYGLIAEEVEAVMPELVAYDEAGQPVSVKYHVLPTLLLAEIQRLERERAAQSETIAAQAKAIDELRDRLQSLERERR